MYRSGTNVTYHNISDFLQRIRAVSLHQGQPRTHGWLLVFGRIDTWQNKSQRQYFGIPQSRKMAARIQSGCTISQSMMSKSLEIRKRSALLFPFAQLIKTWRSKHSYPISSITRFTTLATMKMT